MTEPRPQPARRTRALLVLGASLLASGPAAALLFYTAPRWPVVLERGYGGAAYPWLGRLLTVLTGWCPWSIGELTLLPLLAGIVIATSWMALGFRRARREGLRRLARLGLGLLASASALYAGFVLAWGLNYQRVPFAARLGWPVGPASPAELSALCSELASQVNGLRRGLALDRDPARVRDRCEEGYARLGSALAPALPPSSPSRPKFALLSGLMSHSLTHGMVVPWTHEALINRETPAASLPFALCHEMAHQRGIAREDEANFVGYLAGRLHPDAGFRYSALRFALAEALGQLSRSDPAAAAGLLRGLDPAVREDYRADAAWVQRHRSRYSQAQGRVYDRYLKAQGQRDGILSYGRVVDLLLAERRLRQAGTLPETLR
jgi:hypothetical protein